MPPAQALTHPSTNCTTINILLNNSLFLNLNFLKEKLPITTKKGKPVIICHKHIMKLKAQITTKKKEINIG